MKINVNEASGPVLDWMVAKATGRLNAITRDDKYPGTAIVDIEVSAGFVRVYAGKRDYEAWAPSILWSQGGPIIERETITVAHNDQKSFVGQPPWVAYRVENLFLDEYEHEYQYGPTPLVAAMRCFVASRLGEEVEVPEELMP